MKSIFKSLIPILLLTLNPACSDFSGGGEPLVKVETVSISETCVIQTIDAVKCDKLNTHTVKAVTRVVQSAIPKTIEAVCDERVTQEPSTKVGYSSIEGNLIPEFCAGFARDVKIVIVEQRSGISEYQATVVETTREVLLKDVEVIVGEEGGKEEPQGGGEEEGEQAPPPECIAGEFDLNRVSAISGQINRGRILLANTPLVTSNLSFKVDLRTCVAGKIELLNESGTSSLTLDFPSLKTAMAGRDINFSAADQTGSLGIIEFNNNFLASNLNLTEVVNSTSEFLVLTLSSHAPIVPNLAYVLKQAPDLADMSVSLKDNSNSDIFRSDVHINVSGANVATTYSFTTSLSMGSQLVINSTQGADNYVIEDATTYEAALDAAFIKYTDDGFGNYNLYGDIRNLTVAYSGMSEPSKVKFDTILCSFGSRLNLNFDDRLAGDIFRFNSIAKGDVDATSIDTSTSGYIDCVNGVPSASGGYFTLNVTEYNK